MLSQIMAVLQPVILRAVLKALKDPKVLLLIEDEIAKGIAIALQPPAA